MTTETTLPEAGSEHTYCGERVRVTGTKKRGRGWQVHYVTLDGIAGKARLKDWRKGVQ